MKNVTLLIQGLITQESYNFFVETYPQYPIVFSTWSTHSLDLSYFPHNVVFVTQKLPPTKGHQNINYQIDSTLLGLNCTNTDFVIKIRGDEYYSNLKSVEDSLLSSSDKIWSSPIWFRHFSQWPFHISDHIIAGRTDNLKLMFSVTKHNLKNGLLYHIKDGVRNEFWEPEINLTRSYLMEKYPTSFHTNDGVQMMIDNFDILNLDELKPYKVVANVYKKIWKDNYIPEQNYSLSKINQLLDKPPFKNDTDIPQR